MWCASHWLSGAVHRGKVHPPSRTLSARRIAVVTQPLGAADVQHLGVRAQHDWQEVRVAAQPAQVTCADLLPR